MRCSLVLYIALLAGNLFAELKTVPVSSPKTEAVSSQGLPSRAEKARLYYFSGPGCPACIMMEPFLKEIEKKYADQIEFFFYRQDSKERRHAIKLFIDKVDLRFIPSYILSDSTNRVYTSGKGYADEAEFSAMLDRGLEKQKKLPSMKIQKFVFICEKNASPCPGSEKELDIWLSQHKEQKFQIEKIDLSSFKTDEDWGKFAQMLKSFKYATELNIIPALLGVSKDNEMIEVLQKSFDAKALDESFRGLY